MHLLSGSLLFIAATWGKDSVLSYLAEWMELWASKLSHFLWATLWGFLICFNGGSLTPCPAFPSGALQKSPSSWFSNANLVFSKSLVLGRQQNKSSRHYAGGMHLAWWIISCEVWVYTITLKAFLKSHYTIHSIFFLLLISLLLTTFISNQFLYPTPTLICSSWWDVVSPN